MGRAWGNGAVGMEEEWIGEQGIIYLNYASHLRVGKRLDSRGVPRCPRRCPQFVPWPAEDRAPELVLSCRHTDDYLAYHHRTFI